MFRFRRSFCALAVVATLSVTVLFLVTAQAQQQDPPFLPPVIYDTGGTNPNQAVIADVNGDGKPDLIVANGALTEHGTVGVLLGNGDGTFQPAVTYNAWTDTDYYASPLTIAVADVNGDHRPDVLIGNQSSSYRFSLLLGNGDGTFQPVVGINQGVGADTSSLVVADVNGDGFPDVVEGTTCYASDDCSTGAINVFLGNGDGTFQPTVSYRVVTGGLIALAVADLNGDGKLDVAASVCANGSCFDRGTGAAAVLLGRGDGTFNPAVTYNSVGNAGWSIAISDVNHDGKPDLVLANGDNPSGGGIVGLLLGNGDGTFQPAIPIAPGTGRTRAITAQDINDDGAPDLMVAPYYVFQDPVTVLLGHGDGTFAPTALKILYPFEEATSIVTGDLNDDGRPDLVVTAYPVYGGGLAVLINNTGPHTPSTTTLASDTNPVAPRQPVTYSAAVTGQTGDVTGTVTFMDGTSALSEVKLVNNRAAYTTMYRWDDLRAHSITAVYSGDLYNAGSTSAVLTEYVGTFPVPSKLQLTTSGSPSRVGQPVTFTASVSPTRAKYGVIPDGELVWFHDGNAVLGSASLSGGKAQFTTSSLSAKSHAIKAIYPGDGIFKSSSDAVTQVVNKYSTATALTSSLNPSHHGQAVTFTATVTSDGPLLTGKVKFMDGRTVIGSAQLGGGVATVTKSMLAVGTHPVTALYLGDAANDKSQSLVLNQVVQ